MLDYFFETYLAEGTAEGPDVSCNGCESGYDQAALKARFLNGRKSKVDVDQLLRRE